MATFILVHGGWRGGWTYRRAADLLRSSGHRVFTPSLTGCAEHSHLLSGDVTLWTHVTDIVNLIAWEDLSAVTLVGHSYGGMVITGAAGQVPDRIDALVYLDAVVPAHGQSFVDVYPPALEMFMATATDNRGLYIAPYPAAQFGGNEADRADIDRLGVPFPLAAATERLPPSDTDLAGFKRSYVLATGYDNPYADNRDRLEGDPSWDFHTIDCGHDIMLDEPQQLVDVLTRHI